MTAKRVAVIGAGAGGIAVARRLLETGVDVTVFEIGSHVGGLWVYENDNGLATAYGSLCINSEAKISALPDFPFPPGTPYYPSHAMMADYLRNYADHFGVTPHIRFRSPVSAVRPVDGRWQVTVGDGEPEEFDAVVAAPGHQSMPAHPPWHNDFRGEYVHAHKYRVPEPFAGKHVLVVGVGNSGLDIAADICTVTAETVISARSPVLIMPRNLFGRPVSRFMAKVDPPWLPWAVSRRIKRAVATVTHGRMSQWGLVEPKTRIHPTSHPTIFTHAAHGRVRFAPGVASVDGRTVTFDDGSSEEFDAVIAATGYELSLPFLPVELKPVVKRRFDAYLRVVHPDVADLYFAGFHNSGGGANIPVMDVQARLIAALVTGAIERPAAEAMHRAIRFENRRNAERYPGLPRYGMELDLRRYREQVTKLLLGGR